MKDLKIPATETFPAISCNYKEGKIEIIGSSIPINAQNLYKPLITWLDNYLTQPQPKTTVNINLKYFNTNSSKNLILVFKRLDALYREDYNVEVNWICEFPELDDFIFEVKDIFNVPIFVTTPDLGE